MKEHDEEKKIKNAIKKHEEIESSELKRYNDRSPYQMSFNFNEAKRSNTDMT